MMTRTEQEQKHAVEIFNTFRNEALKRQLSNTENYDKTILTLSSTGLAISLTLLSLIQPYGIKYPWLITASWWMFLVSIGLSLTAYHISNTAIKIQLSIAEDYYVNQNEAAFHTENRLSTINDYLNKIVGITFICALMAVVIFFSANLSNHELRMSKDKWQNNIDPFTKSATVPNMQRIPDGKLGINSAQVPTMQSVPTQPAAAPVPAPQQSTNQSQKTE